MKTINRSPKKVPVAGMKRKLLSAFILGIVPISLASPSYALDYKIYPGSGCQPLVGTESGSFRTNVQGITNISTQNRSVICPLVRDSIPTSASLDPGARVVSPNGGLLQCSFYSMSPNGNIVDLISRSTVSTTPTALIFSGRAIRTQSEGNYSIQCILPPGGRVISYSNGEFEDTNF